jgi:cell division protein FtsB
MIEELKNRSKELQRQINQLKDEEQKNGSDKK